MDKVLRDSFLFTIAGLKPVTMEIFHKLNSLQKAIFYSFERDLRDGDQKNRDLGWFVIDGSRPGSPHYILYVYNRSALERLRQSEEIMKYLRPLGFSKEDSVDSMMNKFEAIIRESSKDILALGPSQIYKYYLLEGLFFGYAPKEVVAFATYSFLLATKASNEEIRKTLNELGHGDKSRHIRAGNHVYISSTGTSGEYDQWFSSTAKEIEVRYARLRQDGISSRAILDHPEILQCEDLLTPPEAGI